MTLFQRIKLETACYHLTYTDTVQRTITKESHIPTQNFGKLVSPPPENFHSPLCPQNRLTTHPYHSQLTPEKRRSSLQPTTRGSSLIRSRKPRAPRDNDRSCVGHARAKVAVMISRLLAPHKSCAHYGTDVSIANPFRRPIIKRCLRGRERNRRLN